MNRTLHTFSLKCPLPPNSSPQCIYLLKFIYSSLFIQDIHLFKLFLRAYYVLLTLTSNQSSRRGTDPILFIALFPVFSGVSGT